MSNEMTAEIRKNFAGLSDFIEDKDILEWYYELIEKQAKEAVKEFAEELILREKQYSKLLNDKVLEYVVPVSFIKHLAKQKGVEI